MEGGQQIRPNARLREVCGSTDLKNMAGLLPEAPFLYTGSRTSPCDKPRVVR